MKTKAYFNWSSGKDSALALYRALNRFDIKALLTVIDSTNNRIPMHGTNLDLLKAQSQSIGIPLVTCDINTEYSEDKYKISLQEIIDKFKSQEISTALFGDIHLLELKIGREEKCRQAGLKTDFPLWNNSPQELLHEFIDSGFKAIITCIDGSVLDKTFVGRLLQTSRHRPHCPQIPHAARKPQSPHVRCLRGHAGRKIPCCRMEDKPR